MALRLLKSTHFLLLAIFISCGNITPQKSATLPDESQITKSPTSDFTKATNTENKDLVLGANRTEAYLPMLEGKRVGIVGNPSSLILAKKDAAGKVVYTHLVDSLLSRNINIVKVFSPEHGFRGTADAGETVKDGKDKKTNLPITSLYGSNKKPTQDQLNGIDILIFDIQDVGVRFYTYIATMHYVMEAAAEAKIPVIILDRPNPNGHYVDGPLMEEENTSFLGMHSGVPLVHGMTIGEYAQMTKGEKCDLTVIQMENYNHNLPYSLPIRPSPNLPNDKAINLYPSLGLLEGTNLNAGRGTEMQFQVIGSPYLPAAKYPLSYTPQPNFGSKSPKHNGELCHGLDLRDTPRMKQVDLTWIVKAYQDHKKKEKFFNTKNFTAHAGTAKLQQQIEQGLSFAEIQKSWKRDLDAFKKIREMYLIYP